jgi:hypothetical protein
MVNKAKEYDYNPLKEMTTLFLKDIETKYKKRISYATGKHFYATPLEKYS